MQPYRFPLWIFGSGVVLAVSLFVTTTFWVARERNAVWLERSGAAEAGRRRQQAEAQERMLEEQGRVRRAFMKAWEPHLAPVPAKDLGNYLRNTMATLAMRTGLTSEGATVPAEPRSYPVGPKMIRVQQVSLNVISESLPAELTWLGAVEERFPTARVESLTLSGYASRSVQLSVTLLHPVEEPARIGASVAGGTSR